MIAIAMSILGLLRTSETVNNSRFGCEGLFQAIVIGNTKTGGVLTWVLQREVISFVQTQTGYLLSV